MEWDDAEAKKLNTRKCDCDFVGCQGCWIWFY
jgi:hypothetical protein